MNPRSDDDLAILFGLFERIRRDIVEFGLRGATEGRTLEFALLLRLDGEPLPYWRVTRSMPDFDDLLAFIDEARATIEVWDLNPSHEQLPPERIG